MEVKSRNKIISFAGSCRGKQVRLPAGGGRRWQRRRARGLKWNSCIFAGEKLFVSCLSQIFWNIRSASCQLYLYPSDQAWRRGRLLLAVNSNFSNPESDPVSEFCCFEDATLQEKNNIHDSTRALNTCFSTHIWAHHKKACCKRWFSSGELFCLCLIPFKFYYRLLAGHHFFPTLFYICTWIPQMLNQGACRISKGMLKMKI